MDQEEQRQAWRDRQRRSRENRAAKEQEQELRDLRRRDPIGARVQEIMAAIAAEDKSKYRPGTPLPDPDPEFIRMRGEKFDAMKAECERKTIEGTKRTLWALSHGLPVGWASLFPHEFPQEAAIASGMTEFPRQENHET